MVSVSEEKVSGIDTHFRKYRIGFGIISPITIVQSNLALAIELQPVNQLTSKLTCFNMHTKQVIHSKNQTNESIIPRLTITNKLKKVRLNPHLHGINT